jgi:hypothetical protein
MATSSYHLDTPAELWEERRAEIATLLEGYQ